MKQTKTFLWTTELVCEKHRFTKVGHDNRS
jgi:hypothetical protein